MYLLDTNACIDFLDARSDVLRRRVASASGRLTISTVSIGELLVGSKTSTNREHDIRQIETFAATMTVAPFDHVSARMYGTIIRDIGVKRNSFDRLIGIQALSLNLILVTRNLKDFADISGLRIEDWTRK